ncbi:glycoside hydrolase N-terminal domain-containing protein [Paenibacillus sp. GD4]|uniref:glycosyl hydrolase family 95 catalytic domain-containing protein n=1 Tax=Paenibacillus sp. GD4 TaxID=3068890 RepID=UPI0027965814|nr:glycoside hydrolase N-terminal domain-containing protein [Paenibacillus sp. GD4]MDQ1913486.1 glycoside hydrolase N-terminal domain-containing protein [Paenibacillus sp. GD4]
MNEGSTANRLVMTYPASWWRNMWREALPSGNGVIGASVFGGVQEETIVLNHAKLWHWGHRDELPDVSATLSETRRLMDEERFLEASWQLANALKEQGYATRLASRFPLAAIRLNMPCKHAFRQYRRTLDMETGEITVAWKDGSRSFERKLFVSRADQAVVYRLSGADGTVSGEIGLQLLPSDRFGDTEQFKELAGTVEIHADDQMVWYAATNDDGTDFGAVMKVLPDKGVSSGASEVIRFEQSSGVLIVVKTFVLGDRKKDWPRLMQELHELTGTYSTYDQLLERHTELHGPLFHSASLELGNGQEGTQSNERLLLDAYEGEAPDSLISKMWSYGRYLFISGTSASADAEPFGLYGLWGGDYKLVWCHNMANENIQMMYWHAHVGGLEPLVPTLFRYYEGLMDDFRSNAQKLYGCRGIYIPAGTTPGVGVPNQIVPVILNWTGAAGWLARHYYEHFRYTGDVEFLKKTALPFMLETMQFYKDFLVTDENGLYKIYPSVSPENTPQNYMPTDGKPLAHPMPTTINATMDVAIVKELLQHLIEAHDAIGVEPAAAAEWKRMLELLPNYRVNEEGAVCEWIHPAFSDRYNHRHLSHLYPVFPGNEVTRENAPGLFEAFDTAVRKREIGAQSGWSLVHMAAIYARLGDGDSALDCLNTLTRSCLLPNLFTLHNDWRGMGISMSMPTAPVQLDANLGWVNAVQELLLQVSPGMIKLLPALPGRWSRGRLTDWRFHTGRVSMEWNREDGTLRAELQAHRDTQTIVKLPDWAQLHNQTLEQLKPSTLGPSYYELRLHSGDRLSLF